MIRWYSGSANDIDALVHLSFDNGPVASKITEHILITEFPFDPLGPLTAKNVIIYLATEQLRFQLQGNTSNLFPFSQMLPVYSAQRFDIT